jgi:hypothetical protein
MNPLDSVPAPLTSLSAAEIDALMAQVACGAVAARTAISLLAVHGESREDSARRVFHALGGSDATELDAHGRPRYVGSGRLVSDVERAIADAARPA